MTVQPTEAPAPIEAATDNLRHVYCMAHGIPATGICGATRNVPALAMQPLAFAPRPQHLCIVCEDLMLAPCPTCKED